MSQLKDLLDREAMRISAPPNALDLVLTRRDRRARTRRIRAGVVGIAVLALLVVVLVRAIGLDRADRTAVQPLRPADVLGLWVDQDGGRLLFVSIDGTYAIDDDGRLDEDPDDAGTVRRVGDALVFTSGAGARSCPEGSTWRWRGGRIAGGSLQVAAGNPTCDALLPVSTAWSRVTALPTIEDVPPPGSGTPITQEQLVGIWIHGRNLIRYGADGTLAVYIDAAVNRPPAVRGTWRIRPDGILVERTLDGCEPSGPATALFQAELIRPGVKVNRLTKDMCFGEAGGFEVHIKLSPR
jgi:hypothetical protein